MIVRQRDVEQAVPQVPSLRRHRVWPTSPRPTRRTVLAAAAAAPAAGMLAGCTASDPQAEGERPADVVTVLTSFGMLGRDSYVHVALANQYFADANLDVRVEPGAGATPNAQALLAGQAQFAVADFSGLIIAASQGVRGVVALAAVQQLPLAGLMSLDPEIERPSDLSGRRIGLPPGAATDLLFDAWAPMAGVANVTRVEMGPQDLIGALVAGRVDAIGQFVVGLPLVQAAAGDREVRVWPYSDHVSDMYGIALLTTTETVESDPQLCERFRDALLRGLDYAVTNPDRAGDILHQFHPESDAQVAAEEVRLMAPYVDSGASPLGHMTEAKVARSVALLEALGAIDDFIEPEQLVAFDLVPGAEA